MDNPALGFDSSTLRQSFFVYNWYMENIVVRKGNTVVAIVDGDLFKAIFVSIQPKDRYITCPVSDLSVGGLKMTIGETEFVLVTNNGISGDVIDSMVAAGWKR